MINLDPEQSAGPCGNADRYPNVEWANDLKMPEPML